MMKRIIVWMVSVCLLAAIAAAQSAPVPPVATQSNPPQATAPQNAAPVPAPAPKIRKHARNRPALRDIDDPRVKDLLARQHAEHKACKRNPSGPGCNDLRTRQKAERRALLQQLRKEGKI